MALFFENKSGIPVTPYKERMIDGSESPNARGSFYSRLRMRPKFERSESNIVKICARVIYTV